MPNDDFRLDLVSRLLWSARASGLFRLSRSVFPRDGSLLILCYHGLSETDEHLWNPELYVTPSLFRSRMETIGRLGYQVLPLGRALAKMHKGTLEGPTAAITFDDGWHNFYSTAWPILREFGFPATVYQTTYYSAYPSPVFDTACSYLLWKGRDRTLSDERLTGSRENLHLGSYPVRQQANSLVRTRAWQLRLSGRDKADLLARLAGALKIDFAEFLSQRCHQLMNLAELGAIAQHGIAVEMHTHTHRMPTEKKLFRVQIEENRRLIETATGRRPLHFCYPNGWYRNELRQWLQEAGVESATTCDPGMANARTDRMFLPRMTDSSRVSAARFEAWLSGIGLVAPLLRRVLTANAASPSKSTEAGLARQQEHLEQPAFEGGEQIAARAAAGSE